MLKRIQSFFSDKFNVFLVFGGIFIILLSAGLYGVANKNAKESLIEKILSEEQITVRFGADSIENFLNITSHPVTLMANYFGEVHLEKEKMSNHLQGFTSSFSLTPVEGAMVADEDGNIIFFSNSSGVNKGTTSIANRDYFVWAKEADEGETFLGEPVLPTEEGMAPEYIIPLATPIYSNGEFSGVLAAAISLSDLSEKYLISLKIFKNSEVFLLSNEGALLHAPYSDLVGINYYDLLEEKPYLGSKSLAKYAKEELAKKREGSTSMLFPASPERKLTPMLAAYSPVEHNGAYWMLALAVPLSEILDSNIPLFINQLAVIVGAFIVLILFVIIITKRKKRVEKDIQKVTKKK
jgi:C4-dicarboxylate-specific signal transduction histidine kinase